jgi:hypothetical protein
MDEDCHFAIQRRANEVNLIVEKVNIAQGES